MRSDQPPHGKSTLGYAERGATPDSARTLVDEAPPTALALDDTMAGAMSPAATAQRNSFVRTTVLPALPRQPAAISERPRFAPVSALGEGGVGEVVLVNDQDIERKVAIKRLRPSQRTPAVLARFAEEVRIVGQLEHPNITPVHDVGIDEEGQHYFVMKYVHGETMESVIERLKAGDPAYVARFTFEHRAEIFLGVLNAVNYAHSRGIVHRDLKPSNIMIGPFGEVVHEVIAAVVSEPLNPHAIKSAFFKAAAPCELADLIAPGLAHDKDKRYPSVAAMIDQLHLIHAGKIPVTCHITLSKRVGHEALHWMTRHPWWFSLVFLGMLVGGGWAAWHLVARLIQVAH